MSFDDHMASVNSSFWLLWFSLVSMWNNLRLGTCHLQAAPCSVIQRTALCSGRQLFSVPTYLPENIKELQANDNSIKVLQNTSLSRYSFLHSLSCSMNSIEVLEVNVFYNTHQLENLILSDNNLNAAYEQNGLALHRLACLRSLDLSGNDLTEEMVTFLLQNMTLLEHLSLSRNVLLRLDESTFRDLHQLKDLNLERNMLLEIEGAFDHLHKLHSLNLAFNHLPCLIKFQLTELVVLNASHNSIEWFISNQDMDDIFQLTILDLTSNRLLFFPFLPTRNQIRILLLSDNLINFYEYPRGNNTANWTTTVSFSNVGNMSELSADLWNEALHGDLSSLQLLDLSRNSLNYFPQAFLNKLSSLTILKLHTNCLDSFDLTLEIPESLLELDLSKNSLSSFYVNQSALSRLSNLTYLNLSLNNLHRLPSKLFPVLTSLKTVDLSYNMVAICSSEKNRLEEYSHCIEWRNLISLQQLFLSGCSLTLLPSCAFEGTPLTHLELSNNPEIFIRHDSLTGLSKTLQHLGLGNTGLQDYNFAPMTHLKSLDISRNSLHHLSKSLLSLNLRLLDLRDNKFTTIPSSRASTLAGKLEAVFLGGNPFNCCSLDWYREFDVINVKDRTEVTCLLYNKKKNIASFRHWPPCGENVEPFWWYVILFLPMCLLIVGITVIFDLTFRPLFLPKFIKKTWRRPTSY